MTDDAFPTEMTGETKAFDWRLILPVFLIVCMYAAGMAAVMPVLPFYVRERGLPTGSWYRHRDRSL